MRPHRRYRNGFVERGSQVTRLEAFVDAAFAFAVTLLAISIDEIPANAEELILALKGIPAYTASFAVVALLWWEHNRWSRHYGLDDGLSIFLSLVYVALAMVFVYPLKIMFSAMFVWLSDGWLPSAYQIRTLEDLRLMFVIYAVALSSIGIVQVALLYSAWRQRDALGLDELERLLTLRELYASLLMPLFAMLSLLLALNLRPGLPDYLYGLPGMVYFGLFGQWLVALYRGSDERRLRAELGLQS